MSFDENKENISSLSSFTTSQVSAQGKQEEDSPIELFDTDDDEDYDEDYDGNEDDYYTLLNLRRKYNDLQLNAPNKPNRRYGRQVVRFHQECLHIRQSGTKHSDLDVMIRRVLAIIAKDYPAHLVRCMEYALMVNALDIAGDIALKM